MSVIWWILPPECTSEHLVVNPLTALLFICLVCSATIIETRFGSTVCCTFPPLDMSQHHGSQRHNCSLYSQPPMLPAPPPSPLLSPPTLFLITFWFFIGIFIYQIWYIRIYVYLFSFSLPVFGPGRWLGRREAPGRVAPDGHRWPALLSGLHGPRPQEGRPCESICPRLSVCHTICLHGNRHQLPRSPPAGFICSFKGCPLADAATVSHSGWRPPICKNKIIECNNVQSVEVMLSPSIPSGRWCI